MRTFEKDFEFDSDTGVRAAKTNNCRIDRYKPIKFDPLRDLDVNRQARIVVHTERVQSELKAQGIVKGGRE